jgi:hypothetical protein
LPSRAKRAWTIWLGLFALAAAGAQVGAQATPAQQQPAAHHHNMQEEDGVNEATPPHGDRGMSPEQQAQAEAMKAMQPGQMMHMDMSHLVLTPLRPPNARDRERKDYRVALADGYRIFMPKMPQSEYHFNNFWNGFVESFTFDPTRPTSLLYKKTPGGGWELTGVMYTAPRSATLEQLDERVPLSVARWHEHVKLCMPQRGTPANWKLFGLNGSITTEKACTEARGRYFPQIFGWMVHVYPYAPRDKAFVH